MHAASLYLSISLMRALYASRSSPSLPPPSASSPLFLMFLTFLMPVVSPIRIRLWERYFLRWDPEMHPPGTIQVIQELVLLARYAFVFVVDCIRKYAAMVSCELMFVWLSALHGSGSWQDDWGDAHLVVPDATL